MQVGWRSGDANLRELDVDAALAPVGEPDLGHGACGIDVEVTLQAPLLDRDHAVCGAVPKQAGEALLDRLASIRPFEPALAHARDSWGEHPRCESGRAAFDLEPALAPLDAHVVVSGDEEIAVLPPRRRRRIPPHRRRLAAAAMERAGAEPDFHTRSALLERAGKEPPDLKRRPRHAGLL
jgi:hypothetical protein